MVDPDDDVDPDAPAAPLRRQEVFRVPALGPTDLAQVSSRYVEETATALDRVLAAAEEQEAVLLLDEADALFSRRTGVRDAHDRYAGTAEPAGTAASDEPAGPDDPDDPDDRSAQPSTSGP